MTGLSFVELRIFTEPQQGASYDDQLAVARAAEDGGFDAFFRSDHYLAMGDSDGLPGPTDAWLTLAGLARETSRIRLGTLVSPATFRLPAILAMQVAQVDQMSGGRVELGLGSGWFESEHMTHGIPFPPIKERFDRLEEQLEIVTGMWSAPPGEGYSFDGQYYTIIDSPALPKPVQARIPVIVGGAGKTRTPALAARFATEFNIGFCTVEEAATQFRRVRHACREIGRDPHDPVYSWAGTTVVGRTDAEVSRRAEAIGADLDTLAATGVAGTPQQVVERLRAFAQAGARRAYLQQLDLSDLDQIELIAAEVLPQLR